MQIEEAKMTEPIILNGSEIRGWWYQQTKPAQHECVVVPFNRKDDAFNGATVIRKMTLQQYTVVQGMGNEESSGYHLTLVAKTEGDSQ